MRYGTSTALLVTFCGLLAHGCASRPPAMTPGLPEPTTQANHATTQPAPALRPASPVKAAELFPVRTRSGEFEITAGRDAGATLTFDLREKDGLWTWTFPGKRVIYVQRAVDGSAAIVREDDFTEGVRVDYDPPMVMLPAELTMGKDVEGESRVVITNLDKGTRRASGTVRYRVSLAGMQDLTTPAGPFEACVVYTQRQMDMDVAQVSVNIHTAYAPGLGQVAERLQRQTRALGIFGGAVEHEQMRLKSR